ncbi:MAG: sigma-54 interaction domain-containing protein [Blastocatellia bacterium]
MQANDILLLDLNPETGLSRSLEYRLKERLGLKQLIGESGAFREAVSKIPLIAQCDATVLISGETGTGKELCARAVHYLSPRARHAFVPINCGAIPTELVENELFGHQRGAFTGASNSQPGLIREADGGTLFLDEIDALPLQAQVKLLRFLQEKEYRPLGATGTRKADVRVIAASNTDFDQAVRSGKLRQDLFYRLNVIPLKIPPLRERREDIPLLSRHFLARYTAEFSKAPRRFSQEALLQLELYAWPGNVRELEHSIARAVALSERDVIESGDLGLPQLLQSKAEPRQLSFREAKAKLIAQFEVQYIQELLAAHQGNISKAARAARKNRRVFWQLIRKYGIEVQNFKTADSPVQFPV